MISDEEFNVLDRYFEELNSNPEQITNVKPYKKPLENNQKKVEKKK